MIGRQVIKTNRSFTLEELEHFMQERWDKAQRFRITAADTSYDFIIDFTSNRIKNKSPYTIACTDSTDPYWVLYTQPYKDG